MFDLEQAILAWRKQMTDAGVKAPVPLEELESHLRDAVEERVRQGLGEAEAFNVASGQMGRAGEIKSEFDKAAKLEMPLGQKWGDRYGVSFFASLIVFYGIWMTRLVMQYALFSGKERTLAFAALAVTELAVFAAWHLVPVLFPIIHNKRVESVVVSLCVVADAVWYVFFAWYVLPRFQFTPGGVRVMTLWAMIPILVAPTFFSVLRRSERAGVQT
jgi:hypothetical protein